MSEYKGTEPRSKAARASGQNTSGIYVYITPEDILNLLGCFIMTAIGTKSASSYRELCTRFGYYTCVRKSPIEPPILRVSTAARSSGITLNNYPWGVAFLRPVI